MSEALSEETSLSDVFYVYLLLLRPRFFTNYVSFHEGLHPPRGPCSLWMVLVSLFLLLPIC